MPTEDRKIMIVIGQVVALALSGGAHEDFRPLQRISLHDRS
jgi:hypothetical protein